MKLPIIAAVLALASCVSAQRLPIPAPEQAQPEGVTVFKNHGVCAFTPRPAVLTTDICPYETYSAPSVPDCGGGAPRDLQCFVACQVQWAQTMESLSSSYCTLYAGILQDYHDCIDIQPQVYNECIAAGHTTVYCRQIWSDNIQACMEGARYRLDELAAQWAADKAVVDQAYLDCASHCCP